MKHDYTFRRTFSALVLLMASTLTWAYVEVDGICYNIIGDASVEVTSHYNSIPYNDELSDYKGDIVIPSTVTYDGKTYNVTRIGHFAFFGCSSLESINIPESVTSIGSEAFRGCSSLTSINIPESVTSNIGDYAFNGCSSLESVNIPDGMTSSIGDYAFFGCSSLTSVVIGDGVTSIGDRAFRNCSSLESVVIGDGVTSIGQSAFQDCSSLESVVIGYGQPDPQGHIHKGRKEGNAETGTLQSRGKRKTHQYDKPRKP